MSTSRQRSRDSGRPHDEQRPLRLRSTELLAALEREARPIDAAFVALHERLSTLLPRGTDDAPRPAVVPTGAAAGRDESGPGGGTRRHAYSSYPFLFRSLFPDIPDDQVRTVAISGRLYLAHLLYVDQQVDGGRVDPWLQLEGQRCQYEALRLLQSLFDGDSPFWPAFTQLHDEYGRAVLSERLLHWQTLDQITTESFEEIARGKSAIAKAAPLALATLAGDSDAPYLPALSESQDHFHIALQYLDDIQDWRDDYRRGHYTLLLRRVFADHGLGDAIEAGRPPDARRLARLLYASPFVAESLTLAGAHLRQADELIADLPLPEWRLLISLMDDMRQRIEQDVARGQRIMRVTQERTISSDGSSVGQAPRGDLDAALERGVAFLLARQEPSVLWNDFFTRAGDSSSWVTGYACAALAGIESAREAAVRALDRLRRARLPEGGWGYNESICPDADSTAWALLALCRLGNADPCDSLVAEGRRVLLDHQNPADGGFRTYHDAGRIRRIMGLPESVSFAGWTGSQTCVTAVAVQSLLAAGHSPASAEIRSALQFLRAAQQPSGAWEAYWWDGTCYATVHALRALQAVGDPEDKPRIERAVDWLCRSHLPDGGWSSGGGVGSSSQPFYTALAVQALSSVPDEAARTAAARGVRWLITHQLPTGGWASTPILRIPAPGDRAPWESRVWPEMSEDGLHILIPDLGGIFTAATAVRALQLARHAGLPSPPREDVTPRIYWPWSAPRPEMPGTARSLREPAPEDQLRWLPALLTPGAPHPAAATWTAGIAATLDRLGRLMPLPTPLVILAGAERDDFGQLDESWFVALRITPDDLSGERPEGAGEGRYVPPGVRDRLAGLVADLYWRGQGTASQSLGAALGRAGLTLALRAAAAPAVPLHQILGLSPLQLAWCQSHLWYLWQRWQTLRHMPASAWAWLVDPDCPARSSWCPPAPGRYLGLCMVRAVALRRQRSFRDLWQRDLDALLADCQPDWLGADVPAMGRIIDELEEDS